MRSSPEPTRLNQRLLALWAVALAAVVLPAVVAAEPLPIEALAARPTVEQAALSPSGRYLSLVRADKGHGAVVVIDRSSPQSAPRAVMGEPAGFKYRWCHFANDTRLLCSLAGFDQEHGLVFGVSRLVAVDVTGEHMLVLLQNSAMVQGQYLDRVLHWRTDDPDIVLIEADEGFDAHQQHGSDVGVIGDVGTHAAPAVFELNVRTGALKLRQAAHQPIRTWLTDAAGAVRIGFGIAGTTEMYYARLAGESELKRIEKWEAFGRDRTFTPLAFSATRPNEVYASAPHGEHEALWRYDLTGAAEPELAISSTRYDISHYQFAADGSLEGVEIEGEKPMFYAVDARTENILESVGKLLPDTFNTIAGVSDNHRVYLIRSRSDKALPAYRVLDLDTKKLTNLNPMPPSLPAAAMSSMQPVQYPARDGTSIPGYLSLPPGSDGKHLPLIVMPHGGPIARDIWGYSFLTQFLTSRGYAVLQMNFRGSSGYGSDWFYAAHQDWGGLTNDDVTDAANWAVAQGIADPKRMCIVGWSFGGYLALLGGLRNPDLYRCAVSIAGIGDLAMLYDDGYRWVDAKIIQKQIGPDRDKLRRDSPREHAADYRVPVLLVQGDTDAQVQPHQGDAMDKALTRAGRDHRYVRIPGADHSLYRDSDRVTLLKEIDAFLARTNPAQQAP
jgi:dienelactone hydrolase